MINFLSVISFAFLLSVQGFASVDVRVSVNYDEIFDRINVLGESFGPENVLVIFDLDDTILVTKDCEIDGKEISGFAKLFRCPSTYTEKGLGRRISEIQESGFHVMALTARGTNLLRATERELSRDRSRGARKISFDLSPFKERAFEGMDLPKRKSSCYKKSPAVIPCVADKNTKGTLKAGVLYSAGGHKAKSLKLTLDRLDLSYSHIVFIDDKYYNIFNFRDEFKDQDDVHVDAYLYLRHRK